MYGIEIVLRKDSFFKFAFENVIFLKARVD